MLKCVLGPSMKEIRFLDSGRASQCGDISLFHISRTKIVNISPKETMIMVKSLENVI